MSDALWFYYRGQKDVVGPLSAEGLEALAASNELSPDTLVCREGTESWLPYSEAFISKDVCATSANSSDGARHDSSKGSNGYVAGAIGFILLVLFVLATSSEPSAELERENRRHIAEGEAILEDMEKYNANPNRTKGERKQIEERWRQWREGE